MTHACPAVHLGLEMWENEGNAYHVYMQLSFGRQFLFFYRFLFLFAYQTYQQQYVAALLPIGSSLSLTDTHIYLYLYLETRADTVRRLLVLGFVFYKEYGSFVEKILGGVV